MILRRLYLYLVSAAALGLLAAGLALLGNTVLLFAFNDPTAQDSRTQLAIYTAMTVVALPVWGVHFWFARRFAHRDPAERASAIRRLYLYWACVGGAIGTLVALSFTASNLIRPLIDTCPTPVAPGGFSKDVAVFNYPCPANPNWLVTSQAAWVALVFIAIWAFHYLIAARDRAAVGETGASATLRRWYMYLVLLVALLTMLSGASSLIEVAWLKAIHSSLADGRYMGDPAGVFVAGAIVWGFHAFVVARDHVADDRHSTLRALQGFIVVAVSIATALAGASQILYYALARALGVDHPGGVSTEIIAALAAPASQVVVYGAAWFLTRRRLAMDARAQEADRQAAIRRLYTNLAALVSLGAWGVGAGGLLWTLAEQIEAPIIGVKAANWKDPVSLWVTLLVVGAAVWVAHWRPAPWAADRQSLSRRLYVWAALLASVLVVLAAGVGMLNALLQQLFSAHPKLNDSGNLDFGHYLAVIVVAAAVGFYHWRVLRADAAARPPKAAVEAAPVPAAIAPPTPAPIHPAEMVEDHARHYVLSVTDATEDDVHQALANLPPQASYKLTADERVGR
jgi:heme/copper-type cytochrome/quinol oxidase subunit 2